MKITVWGYLEIRTMHIYIDLIILPVIIAYNLVQPVLIPQSGVTSNDEVSNLRTVTSFAKELSKKCNTLSETFFEDCEIVMKSVRSDDHEYFDYKLALCMNLLVGAKRLCDEKSHNTRFITLSHNKTMLLEYLRNKEQYTNKFICKNLMTSFPKSSSNNSYEWVTVLSKKFNNSKNCERECLQEDLVNPLCMTLLWTNNILKSDNLSSELHNVLEKQPNRTTNGADLSLLNKPVKSNLVEVNEKLHLTSTVNEYSTDEDKTEEHSSPSKNPNESSLKYTHNKMVHDTKNASTKSNTSLSNSSLMSKLTNTANNEKEEPTKKSDSNPGKNQEQSSTLDESAASVNSKITEKKADSKITVEGNKYITSPVVGSTQVQIPSKPEIPKESVNNINITSPKLSTSDPKKNSAEVADLSPESDIKAVISSTVVAIKNEDAQDKSSLTENPNDLEMDYNSAEQSVRIGGEDTPEAAVESPVIDGNDEDDADIFKPVQQTEVVRQEFVNAEDSHFFAYFMTMMVLCIIGYLVFHNKQKILALALEGRSRRGTRRRPSTSGYRKLDSNLEEAVTSSCSTSVTHVIY